MTERKKHLLYDNDEEGNRVISDQPWIFRTYAGHSNARASNQLYRMNLAKGQTGLSIAFDLPTQCGYSSDHPIARPEIGKVGVPVNSLDDFHILFEDIPLTKMNTSMTINATSMWLLALYIALAKERKEDITQLQGTTQNDIIKEYLARGTYIFPPKHSLSMIAEMYEYCLENVPKWNPSNICSYHLQEAGATPAQELSFALSSAIGILDLIRSRDRISKDKDQFERIVGRISFFVNSGMRFIEELSKMRAFCEMWEKITKERYGVQNPHYQRFRYGVQVNSLGLTEAQPENNAWRILIETLGITLSRKARCRALQLPAWNEALSLPRPWDQQWSLRLQQILAYETDLLEYPDIFDGSPVITSKVNELKEESQEEITKILSLGGIEAAIESGYMKKALVSSMSHRIGRITTGEQIVVGLNRWQDGLASPLVSEGDGGMFQIDEKAAQETLSVLEKTKKERDPNRATIAIEALKNAARENKNMMEASIECALARITTGEWAFALREVFGEYRPATGVDGQKLHVKEENIQKIRQRIELFIQENGHRPRIVVGKPGLDGHSNGAEIIALGARHAGFDVIYAGIRLSPKDIVQSAIEENADIIGISILSGSHIEMVRSIMDELKNIKAEKYIPVVLGGIVPQGDIEILKDLGICAIFTPSDYDVTEILSNLMDIVVEKERDLIKLT